MKPIQTALHDIDGHFLSLTRNTNEGYYEIEIGIPNSWVYDETNEVGCEVTLENEEGKLIRIYPKKRDVVPDDLFEFAKLILGTNKIIADKEKKFEEKFKKIKEDLANDAKKFYEELEEMKKDSFKNLKLAEKKEKKEKKQEILEIEPETTKPSEPQPHSLPE